MIAIFRDIHKKRTVREAGPYNASFVIAGTDILGGPFENRFFASLGNDVSLIEKRLLSF